MYLYIQVNCKAVYPYYKRYVSINLVSQRSNLYPTQLLINPTYLGRTREEQTRTYLHVLEGNLVLIIHNDIPKLVCLLVYSWLLHAQPAQNDLNKCLENYFQ